jgi:uncharacterized membrane protein YhaH (DUF805 family)
MNSHNVFRNVSNFKGKSTRREFIIYAVTVYAGLFFTKGTVMSIYEHPIEGLLALLSMTLLLFPAPALVARRLNDGGHSLKWLFSLIALIFIWGVFASCAEFLFTKKTLIYDICVYASFGVTLAFVILCLLVFIFCIAGKSKTIEN